jgi:thiamine biosynthesis protein ThiS
MLKLNGQDHPWHPGLTVSSLLREKNYIFHAIIVRVNDQFIPSDEYDGTAVNDGDDVQAIHLISGG